jgi:hypothetical protein
MRGLVMASPCLADPRPIWPVLQLITDRALPLTIDAEHPAETCLNVVAILPQCIDVIMGTLNLKVNLSLKHGYGRYDEDIKKPCALPCR